MFRIYLAKGFLFWPLPCYQIKATLEEENHVAGSQNSLTVVLLTQL